MDRYIRMFTEHRCRYVHTYIKKYRSINNCIYSSNYVCVYMYICAISIYIYRYTYREISRERGVKYQEGHHRPAAC